MRDPTTLPAGLLCIVCERHFQRHPDELVYCPHNEVVIAVRGWRTDPETKARRPLGYLVETGVSQFERTVVLEAAAFQKTLDARRKAE